MNRGTKIHVAMACALAASCTHRQLVHQAPPSLIGQRAEIEIAGGRTERARLQPSPVGVVWRTDAGELIVPGRVKKATVRGPGRGNRVVLGLGWGALIGAVVGAVAGYYSGGEDPTCGPDDVYCPAPGTPSSRAKSGALLGLFNGGAWGALIGALAGGPTVYEFVAPQDRRRDCEQRLAAWRRARAGTWDKMRRWDEMPAACQAIAD